MIIDGLDYGPEIDYGDSPAYLWVDRTGTVPQNGDQVTNTRLIAAGAATEGPDRWGGFFSALSGMGTKVLDYAIARDAQRNNLVLGRSPNGQPVYQPAGVVLPAPSGNTMGLLLLAAAAVGVVLLVKKD